MDDDNTLTLRAPRGSVAFVVALGVHVAALFVIRQLPEPKKPEERIEMTVTQQSPKPPPPSAPPPPKKTPKKQPPSSNTPPATSPVQPALPPSEKPPENAAILPPTETSPEPAPPPQPSAWKQSLLSSLAETTPRATPPPTGVLAPSFRTLQTVANNDMRLHDDEQEAQIAENFGPFFRRGIEALRRTWHPEEPLLNPEVRQRCQTTLRTTQAVATLDRNGKIIDVEVKRGSGCPELDAEAVKAWKLVAELPHPPKGLFVLPDGTPSETARMPVRFIVSFDGGLRLTY